MLTVKEDTTLVGVTELRHNIDKVIRASAKHRVIVEKRNKPVAALMSIAEYDRIQEILDLVEDGHFGSIAKERYEQSGPSDYIPLEKVRVKRG